MQRADVGVAGLQARLIAAVLEDRAGLAIFDFLVLVVGIGEVQLDALEWAGQVAQLAGQAEAFLVHLQAHVGFGDRPVVGVVTAVGQAGVAMFAGP